MDQQGRKVDSFYVPGGLLQMPCNNFLRHTQPKTIKSDVTYFLCLFVNLTPDKGLGPCRSQLLPVSMAIAESFKFATE